MLTELQSEQTFPLTKYPGWHEVGVVPSLQVASFPLIVLQATQAFPERYHPTAQPVATLFDEQVVQ
jgi:hypothetical protein